MTLCREDDPAAACTPPFSAHVSAAAARWLEYLAVAALVPMVFVAPMMTAYSGKVRACVHPALIFASRC